MKIQNALVSNIFDRSQRYFAHVTTVLLSWRVQNIVVIGSVYFTLECFEFSSNFEFDRNMLSGTGARSFGSCTKRTKIGRAWSFYSDQLSNKIVWDGQTDGWNDENTRRWQLRPRVTIIFSHGMSSNITPNKVAEDLGTASESLRQLLIVPFVIKMVTHSRPWWGWRCSE